MPRLGKNVMKGLMAVDESFGRYLYEGIHFQGRLHKFGYSSSLMLVEQSLVRLETLVDIYPSFGWCSDEDLYDLDINFEVLRLPEEF